MSAIDFSAHTIRLGLAALILTSVTTLATAQSAVTDADIARAQRHQPQITEADIRQAQLRARTPTDAEIARVPIPSAPRLDRLPQPNVTAPIDLEQLAKGYEAQVDRMHAAAGWAAGPQLLVFISFTLPQPTLQRLVEQAARANAVLVIRGLVKGSLRDTVAQAHALIGTKRVAFQIDPQAFARFAITRAPTFVLVRSDAPMTPCGNGQCIASDAFVSVAGDVSLDYALDAFSAQAPRFAPEAQVFLKKLRG